MGLRREIISCAGDVDRCCARREPVSFSATDLEEGEKVVPFAVCPDRLPEASFRHRPAGQLARPFRQGFQQVKCRCEVDGRYGREFEPSLPRCRFPQRRTARGDYPCVYAGPQRPGNFPDGQRYGEKSGGVKDLGYGDRGRAPHGLAPRHRPPQPDGVRGIGDDPGGKPECQLPSGAAHRELARVDHREDHRFPGIRGVDVVGDRGVVIDAVPLLQDVGEGPEAHLDLP